MRLIFQSIASAALACQTATSLAHPVTFAPLSNQTPIAVFASKVKAVVTDQGYVLLKPPSNGPDDPSSAWGTEGKPRHGPLLKTWLSAHSVETANISQQYTHDSAPVVKTDYRWPDAQLSLWAFAAEPEAAGFYLMGKVLPVGKRSEPLKVNACLENTSGGRLLEKSLIVDSHGQVVLRVARTGGTGRSGIELSEPLEAIPICLGVAFQFAVTPSESVDPDFALQLPINSGISSEYSAATKGAASRSAPEALAWVNSSWREHLDGGITLKVPDARLQSAWDANVKQLGTLLEPQLDGLRILKGLDRYRESTVYDTLQGSITLDTLGYTDIAEALLRRQLKRTRPDGVFEMVDESVPGTRPPDQWIVQGLAALAIWKHYQITNDRRWLEEAWPVVLRSAKATLLARTKSSSTGTQGGIHIAGFVPPGIGDGGVPFGYSLGQNLGPLTGVWVAAEMATRLQAPERDGLSAAYEAYKSDILRVMRASSVSAGEYKIVPSFPGAEPEQASKHLWGPISAVYPFSQISPDDPLVLPTLRFLSANKHNELHLNLGYSSGVWPYMSAAIAHWHLRLGEFEEAFRIHQAILDYASPTWGWYEEIEENPKRAYIDIPDAWATCELLHLTRDLLLLERDDTLLIGPAVPPAWQQPGNEIAVGRAPTLLGTVSYKMSWDRRSASAIVTTDGERRATKIIIALLPSTKSKPDVTVSGATLESIEGRTLVLGNVSRKINVSARW